MGCLNFDSLFGFKYINITLLVALSLVGVYLCTFGDLKVKPNTKLKQATRHRGRYDFVAMKDAIMCSQEDRWRHLQEQCRLFRKSHNASYFVDRRLFNHCLVDDGSQMILCYVTKTASSSWKALMIEQGLKRQNSSKTLTGDTKVFKFYIQNTAGLYHLSHISTERAYYLFDSYFTFLIVRHPYVRLLSAYKDKFLWKYDTMGKKYESGLNEVFQKQQFSRESPMTFEQFLAVQVTQDPRLIKMTRNAHWAEQYPRNFNCYVQYNYTAKIETLKGDAVPILARFGVSELPQRNVYDKQGPTDRAEVNLIESIDRLPGAVKKRLYERYAWDFRLYGYGWEEGVGPTCTIQGTQGTCC